MTLSIGIPLLRNEPVQARSTARLSSLLDAAAAVVDEIGYERLTTAMVAEKAGASIGTVYRYFPDRIVVLQNLSARYLSEFTERGFSGLAGSDATSWADALGVTIDALVEFFRTEPGFKSLRFGDVIDVRPRESEGTGEGAIAAKLVEIGSENLALTKSDGLAFHLEVALETADALLERAFAFEPNGDSRFIAEARAVATGYLSAHEA
jgi:AcrR family transcriptional regulator